MEKKEMLDAALDALDRLLKMFTVERYVYLALTSLAFLFLLYSAYLLFTSNEIDTKMLVGIFGSSGLIAASSARISWFFNKAFVLIEELIRSFSK